MKLYLSSVGVPDREALLRLLSDTDSLSVAVIPTAWDVYTANRREPAKEAATRTFESMGITPTFVDITAMQEGALRTELESHQMVWVMGGNSFYLNYFVHKSGLDRILPELLAGGLVYGGESAGAAIAGATLHGVERLDNPADAPQVIWDGLGLVLFGLVPHWGMEKYGQALQACKAEMETYTTVQTLANDQAIVVIDGDVRLVTG